MRNKILEVYAVSVILGVLIGIVGSVFQMAISAMDQFLINSFHYFNLVNGALLLASACVSMIMVYLSWLMVQRIAAEAAGSGVQEIEGTLLHVRKIHWRRLLPVKFVGGVLAISSKMVLGREGPTIQMGGNLGEMLGQWFRLRRSRRDALIAAGSAAGLSTAFNAPLAGVLFVLEEMREEFRYSFSDFQAVAICCVVATIVLHRMLGANPAISMKVFALPSLESLILFFIFGILVGGLGVVFNITLMKTLYFTDNFSLSARRVFVLAVGALMGLFAYSYPEVVGGGYGIIQTSLLMRPTWGVLLFLFVARFCTTMLCYNTGIPGGVFAPMLALGSLLGLASSYFLHWLMAGDMSIHYGMFAVAGMGGFFAAAVRAPVTGIVLVVEMTQNYSLILPLMITCLTSTTVAQWLRNPPIYQQLLRRTLLRERSKAVNQKKAS